MVDRAPQVPRLACNPDNHLVEMPVISRAWAALPQPSHSTIGPNFSTQLRTVSYERFKPRCARSSKEFAPRRDSLIREVQATLGKEFLHARELKPERGM